MADVGLDMCNVKTPPPVLRVEQSTLTSRPVRNVQLKDTQENTETDKIQRVKTGGPSTLQRRNRQRKPQRRNRQRKPQRRNRQRKPQRRNHQR
ncbi:hypothetical protein TNCV_1369401 [Trichonephila clavipes]|nr:hypothetical protein TNCV_1369401 [Trichonephila clavipes]